MIVRGDVVVVNPGGSIQDAIDSLPAMGGVVQLSAGYYDIKETIVFPTDRMVWLRGDGPTEHQWGYGTIIHQLAAARDVDSIHLRCANQRVSDLAIVTDSVTGATGGVGIRVGYTATVLRHISIENVNIVTGGGFGILFEGVETLADGRLAILSRVINCTVTHSQAGGGIKIETGCTTIEVRGSAFLSNAGTNVAVYGTDNVTFDNCTSEEAGSNHVIVVGAANANRSTVFRSCYFEESTASSVHFITGNGGPLMNLSIIDCIFVRAGAGFVKAVKIVDAAVCYGLVIENAQGSASQDSVGYVGTDCISIGAAAVGSVVRGGLVETGAHAHYYKLVILDGGTGTLVYQPTHGTTNMTTAQIPGVHMVPRATKAQLVAMSTARSVIGLVAYNTTDNTFCVGDNAGWRPLTTVGAALS